MPDSPGDVFTHPVDHVAALVLLFIVVASIVFVLRTVLRVRATWRAAGLSRSTVRGLMAQGSAASQLLNRPDIQKLIAEQMAMNESSGQVAQPAAARIANLEQLHAQGQLSDARLTELKAAIHGEGTTAPEGDPEGFSTS